MSMFRLRTQGRGARPAAGGAAGGRSSRSAVFERRRKEGTLRCRCDPQEVLQENQTTSAEENAPTTQVRSEREKKKKQKHPTSAGEG